MQKLLNALLIKKEGSPVRKALAALFALLFLCTAVFAPCSARAEEPATALKKVTVALDDSNLFVTLDNAGNPTGGYAYEYIQSLAAYAGWKVEYVPCGTFSDCLQAVIDGKADLYYDVSFTEERAKVLLYPDAPMGTEAYYLYCLSDNNSILSGDYASYNGKNVGITANTYQIASLHSWAAENNITWNMIVFASDSEKEAALEAGEIDLNCEINLLAKNNYSALVKIDSSDFYLVTGTENTNLLEDINRARNKIDEVDPFFVTHLTENYFAGSSLSRSLSEEENSYVLSHNTLKIGYMDDYLPFSDQSNAGEPVGLVKDIVPMLLENIGMEKAMAVEYIGFASSNAMLQALREGGIDAAFPVLDSYGFASEQSVCVTFPVISLSADLVFRGDYSNATVTSMAVNRNNVMQEYYVKTNFPGAETRYYETPEECLQAVIKGEVGSAILNGIQSGSLLTGEEKEALVSMDLLLPFSFSFAVREGNTALLSLLNRGIAAFDSGIAYSIAFDYINSGNADTLAGFLREHKTALLMIAVFVLLIFLCTAVIFLVYLNRTRHKLAEANRAKTAFLFNMSHDIRTPMNAILGFTEMAEESMDNKPVLTECLRKTRESGNLLLSLINSVLEMSRIEAGKAELDEKPGRVDFSFSNIESTMQELAKQKNIDLQFSYGTIPDKYVYVDTDRANRIFINLISNAVKYTENGGRVRVRCEQAGRQGDRGMYRFTVEDNGIGMSEDFQKRLFEEFARENNTTVSGVQGSGLGLSVAKSFVELMGGRISCQSKQGEGTVFTVTLPLRLQTGEEGMKYTDPLTQATVEACSEKEAAPENKFAGKRVLLVEDNELNREIATFILEKEEMLVEEAEDGSVAVELLREKGANYYDAILMDIQMPIMNGYEATKAIRAMYPEAKLPIIAVSANAFAEDKAASLASGMNAHIAKPINVQELLQTLTEFM